LLSTLFSVLYYLLASTLRTSHIFLFSSHLIRELPVIDEDYDLDDDKVDELKEKIKKAEEIAVIEWVDRGFGTNRNYFLFYK